MGNPNNPYEGLTIICNRCGEPMRDMGEWPVVFPKVKDHPLGGHHQQAARYTCTTCRYPADPAGDHTAIYGIAILIGEAKRAAES
jgi:hypothetical protein